MNNPETTEQEQAEAKNMRLLIDRPSHKYVRKMAAEWECSYQAAAERIIREAAQQAESPAQQQTSAA